jgi:hypothetical protein
VVAAFVEVCYPEAQARAFAATPDNDVVLSMFEAAPDRALATVRVPVLAIYRSQDTVLAPAPIPGAPPVADSTMPIVTGWDLARTKTGHRAIRSLSSSASPSPIRTKTFEAELTY